jgi:hypothetical protein
MDAISKYIHISNRWWNQIHTKPCIQTSFQFMPNSTHFVFSVMNEVRTDTFLGDNHCARCKSLQIGRRKLSCGSTGEPICSPPWEFSQPDLGSLVRLVPPANAGLTGLPGLLDGNGLKPNVGLLHIGFPNHLVEKSPKDFDKRSSACPPPSGGWVPKSAWRIRPGTPQQDD